VGLALTSAVLLVLSFPSFNQPWCAWVALMPWLTALRGLSGYRAFWWSYLIGLLFFLGSIWWLIYVTVVGWILLCAYLALFFGAFGWVASRVSTGHWPLATGHWIIPAAWVALEYLRSHLLSGFGWNLLAYSQAPWWAITQCADLTGAWGVSFLLVLVNTALERFLWPETGKRERMASVLVVMVSLAAALNYSAWRIPQVTGRGTTRVAVVQGNIPQEEKWDAAFQGRIQQRYLSLTREAAATNPDLIVWPETSVPGFLGVEEAVTRPVTELAKSVGHALLVGAPVPAFSVNEGPLFNSAILLNSSGQPSARYDKLHLVPFGEFIPGERFFPWLRPILPPIGDFIPGHSYTVFRTPVSGFGFRVSSVNSKLATQNSELRFSTLICFEDIFPELARRFVREGARLLLVITNDAWFGPTAAAYQHAQASTFRAIELRVPVARAANTGWSGGIDPAGRWIGSVHDAAGRELFVAGTRMCHLPSGSADSFYLRWGDWFAWLCVAGTLGWIVYNRLRRLRKVTLLRRTLPRHEGRGG